MALIDILKEKLENTELFELVDSSLSSTEVLKKLGYAKKGQYVKLVGSFLLDNNIDTSHFTSNGKPKVDDLEKICPVCKNTFYLGNSIKEKNQVTCSYSCSNTYFRSGKNNPNWKDGKSSYREKALNYYGKKCVNCGNTNEIVLQVHHIDHNRSNNNLSNLKVLCANCHLIEHSK